MTPEARTLALFSFTSIMGDRVPRVPTPDEVNAAIHAAATAAREQGWREAFEECAKVMKEQWGMDDSFVDAIRQLAARAPGDRREGEGVT